jgi:hypothetical protein
MHLFWSTVVLCASFSSLMDLLLVWSSSW